MGSLALSDCFCYDPAILALDREGRQNEPTIAQLTNQSNIEEALAAGEKLIDIGHRRLNVSWESIGGMNYNLFSKKTNSTFFHSSFFILG